MKNRAVNFAELVFDFHLPFCLNQLIKLFFEKTLYIIDGTGRTVLSPLLSVHYTETFCVLLYIEKAIDYQKSMAFVYSKMGKVGKKLSYIIKNTTFFYNISFCLTTPPKVLKIDGSDV